VKGHFIAILRKEGTIEKEILSTRRIKTHERSSRLKNKPFYNSMMDEFSRSGLNNLFFPND